MKKDNVIGNIFAAVGANVVSLGISIILSLFIPKILGVEEYAYWQIYSLIISYAGFFQLGMIDGMYLKLGGIDYKNIDKKLHKTIYTVLCVIKGVVLALFVVFCFTININENNKIILIASGLAISLVLDYAFFSMLMEAANRIKASSKLMIIFKVSYGLLVVLLFLFGYRSYQSMIFADILSKIIVIIFSFHLCKDIIFAPVGDYSLAFTTMKTYTFSGINLMLANIAGMLVTGISRFFIVGKWGLEVFGNISIAMTIANLLFAFMSTLSVVFFPILRRTDERRITEIYAPVRVTLVVSLLLLIGLYYPIYLIFKWWLPQYIIGLQYMALLFPMVIFESKATLLLNTYLKTKNRERDIFKANILSVVTCIILSFLFACIFDTLNLTVVSVVLVLFFKALLLEMFLCGNKFLIQNVTELIISIVFMYLSWNYRGWISMEIYFGILLIILIMQKEIIIDNIKKFFNLLFEK